MKNIIPLTLVVLISGTLAYNYLSDSIESQIGWSENLPDTTKTNNSDSSDTNNQTTTRRVPENNNDTQPNGIIIVDPEKDPFRRQQQREQIEDTSYEEAIAEKQIKESTVWDALNESYIYKNPNDRNIFITIQFLHIYLGEDKETPSLYKINITYTNRARTQSSTVFLSKSKDNWECNVFSHWLRIDFASLPPVLMYQGQTYLPN